MNHSIKSLVLLIVGVFALFSNQAWSADITFNEDVGTGMFNISLQGPCRFSQGCSAEFFTVDDTARAGVDYRASTAVLRWAEGESEIRSFSIPIIDNDIVDGNRIFNVDNRNRVNVAATRAFTVEIIDDERVGIATISATDADAGESNNNRGEFSILLDRPAGSGGVSIGYSIAGSATADADYNALSGSVRIAEGSNSGTVEITAIDDGQVESEETVVLKLQAGNGYTVGSPDSATVRIADNDVAGVLQFNSDTFSVAEDAGSVVITVSRSNGSSGAVSVDFSSTDDSANAGSDYISSSGTLQWADGESGPKTFQVEILDDALIEGVESINLTLSNPTGSATLGNNSSARIQIQDVEAAGSLQFSDSTYSISEGGTRITISVTRVGGNTGAVSVEFASGDGSATPGEDYTAISGTLRWNDGDSAQKSFVVEVNDDAQLEGNETIELTLSNPGQGATLGNPNQATLTIVDDESPADDVPAAINNLPGGTLRGGIGDTIGPLTVQVTDNNDQPLNNIAIEWTVSPPEAGSLQNSSTSTNENGESKNSLTINQNVEFTVLARIGDIGSTRFDVNGDFAAEQGLNKTQDSVAAGLDGTCDTLQQRPDAQLTAEQRDFLATCEALSTSTELATALDALAPDELAAQGSAAVETMAVQSNNLFQRTSALRAQATGTDLAGLSLNLRGQVLPGIVFNSLLAQGGGAGDEGNNDFGIGRWGVFVNGSVSFGDKSTTDSEPGFDFETTGITAGVDYRLRDNLVIGLAGGMRTNESDLGSNGHIDVEGLTLSLYGTYYQEDEYYLDAIVSIGQNSYDTLRNITFGSIDQGANGDTDGTELALSVGGGFDYYRNAISFGPYAEFNWVRSDIDAYEETASRPQAAGSGLLLGIASQEVTSMTVALGGQITYAISTDRGVFSPQLRFDWEHQFEDDNRQIEARFLSDPANSVFSVGTDEPDRDFFNIGAGVSGAFKNGKSAFLYWESVLDRDDISQYSITGGVRVEF